MFALPRLREFRFCLDASNIDVIIIKHLYIVHVPSTIKVFTSLSPQLSVLHPLLYPPPHHFSSTQSMLPPPPGLFHAPSMDSDAPSARSWVSITSTHRRRMSGTISSTSSTPAFQIVPVTFPRLVIRWWERFPPSSSTQSCMASRCSSSGLSAFRLRSQESQRRTKICQHKASRPETCVRRGQRHHSERRAESSRSGGKGVSRPPSYLGKSRKGL